MKSRSIQNEGFRTLEEFVCQAIVKRSAPAPFRSREADIKEPAILIRIKQRVRDGVTGGEVSPDQYSEAELYQATRSAWFVGPKRDQAEYAFSVYRGEVLEVYCISEWHRTNKKDARGRVRYEFEGKKAVDIRDRYIGRSVRHYFKKGTQAPFIYVNIP